MRYNTVPKSFAFGSVILTVLTLTRPDDWHLHLRDSAQMKSILPYSAKQFARAVIMPNLMPPVITTAMAQAYRQRILAALTDTGAMKFDPLMTLYLTDNTQPDEIIRAKKSGLILGMKLYPAGATTHSGAGVTDIAQCYAALETMEQIDLPLLIHGEVTDPVVDVFDREKIFIDKVLFPLVRRYPDLRIVLEHITTSDAVAFVNSVSHKIAATITAHHLLLSRNAIFKNGIQPHYYCLPVLKRERHRQALIEAVIGGSKKFFLGTDSAPHKQSSKEGACGCAGIFTAHAAIEFYAEAFEQAGALEKLEGFASFYGADFYQLPRNNGQIALKRESWSVPDFLPFGEEKLIPMRAGQHMSWRMVD